ncbi:hypothetical protein ACJX0J_005957, partial [Zea mays]
RTNKITSEEEMNERLFNLEDAIGRATATPNIIVIMQLEISKNFSHFQPPLGQRIVVGAHVVGWKRRKYRGLFYAVRKEDTKHLQSIANQGHSN